MSGLRVVRADVVPNAVQLLEDRPELRGLIPLADALDQVGRWSA